MTAELKQLKIDGAPCSVEGLIGKAKVVVLIGDGRNYQDLESALVSAKQYSGYDGLLIDISTTTIGRAETFVSMVQSIIRNQQEGKTRFPFSWIALSRPSGKMFITWMHRKLADTLTEADVARIGDWHTAKEYAYPSVTPGKLQVVKTIGSTSVGIVAKGAKGIFGLGRNVAGYVGEKAKSLKPSDSGPSVTLE